MRMMIMKELLTGLEVPGFGRHSERAAPTLINQEMTQVIDFEAK